GLYPPARARVDVGEDQPVPAGELGGELPQPRAHLEHTAAAARDNEVVLVAPVAGLVGPALLDRAPGGAGERAQVSFWRIGLHRHVCYLLVSLPAVTLPRG